MTNFTAWLTWGLRTDRTVACSREPINQIPLVALMNNTKPPGFRGPPAVGSAPALTRSVLAELQGETLNLTGNGPHEGFSK